MLKYMALGVDYLNTDRPDLLIDLKKKTATVDLSAEIADEAFISTITEAGYEVKKI